MDKFDSIVRQVLHHHALRVGDQIVVIDDEVDAIRQYPGGIEENRAEARGWGYRGEVIGFAHKAEGRWEGRETGRKPGFYEYPHFPQVRLEDGRELYLYAQGILPIDYPSYRARLEELYAQKDTNRRGGGFVCDLPDTVFWEGDLVRIRKDVNLGDRRMPEGDALMISCLDFSLESKYARNGTGRSTLNSPDQPPRYVISDRFRRKGHSYWLADELELVTRGNHWKKAHGEPLVFEDLDEEAFFFCESGEIENVPSRFGHPRWNKDDAIQAIRDGRGHGLRYESHFSGWGSDDWWEVIRFRDETLGRRIAEATLSGFVIPCDAYLSEKEQGREPK